MPLHLAGYDPEVRRLHLRLRTDGAWLVPDPCLSVQQGPLDSYRRDARTDVAGSRVGARQYSAIHRLLRESLWPVPRRSPAAEQRESPARLCLAEFQPRDL